jgi:hypothetical protein
MEWLLFIEIYNGILKITFANKYGIEIYKNKYDTKNTSDTSDTSDKTDFEKNVMEIMNYHVAIRDSVYILCDIRSDTYDFIIKSMPRLLSRVKAILDLDSFNITMKINDKEKEISYTIE